MSKYIGFQRQMVEVMDTLHFRLRQDHHSILAHRCTGRGLLKTRITSSTGFEKDSKAEAITLNVLHDFRL